MITTFQEYQSNGGTAITTEEAYNKAEPMAELLIDAYIKSQIPFWRVRRLADYDLDLTAVIISQIDYIETHGGTEAYAGNSDLALKSVSTSGFTYGINDGVKVAMYYNIPFSPMAKQDLDYQLLRTGLSGKALW